MAFPDASTRLVTLLGHPVEHSLSPRMHNAAFRHLGLNLVYLATDVRPADLPAAVEGLRAMGLRGANVTLPHKETIRPLLDACSDRARAVGAVNTVVCVDTEAGARTLHGDNTDVAGFLAPLAPFADRLHGTDQLIFGAGGAARAAAYALLTTYQPSVLTLAVRTPARAEALARDLAPFDARGALRVVALAEAEAAVATSRLLVNATPLGMHPHVEGTPWARQASFHRAQVVYDLVYAPQHTRLLREAGARGATTVGGLGMLIGQAAAAFTAWTGHPFPLEVVRQALG